jgi:uncharacterized membrane protein YqhA
MKPIYSILFKAMFKKILRLRYIVLLGVIFTFLNSVFFIIAGVVESVHGYVVYFKHGISEEHRPGLYLLNSLDMFLVAIVFMIFALGIMKIFTHYHVPEEDLPGWLKIKNFKELKVLLWETILVTMVVFSLTRLIKIQGKFTWDQLILPCIILILTVSLYLVKKEDKH